MLSPTVNALRAFPQLAYSAVSTDWGLIVKYVGTEASGLVLVDASGDITFTHGVLGSEAVDSTINSGLWSGTTTSPGIIDVSDSSSMTFGEVVDLINKSPNWVAVLGGVTRTDLANDTLLVMSGSPTAQQAKIDGGIKLYKDSPVGLDFGHSVTKETVDGGSNAGYQICIESIRMNVTNTCSGATTMVCEVYSRNEQTGVETYLDSFVYVSATERIIDHNDWGGGLDGKLWAKEGESLLVKIQGGTGGTVTMTVPTLVIRAFYAQIGTGMLNAGHYKSER